MKVKEAVVLAAGKGTRLLPITETTPKPLLKIAGKEIIGMILNNLENSGIEHAVIVVNYLTEKFHDFLDKFETNMEIELISQVNKKGTAYAIYSAKDLVGDHFLVASGDHVLDGAIYDQAISNYKRESLVMLKEVENPKNYGVAILEGDTIKELEEKPEHPRSNLSNIGVYVFNSDIFKEIEGIKLSSRGEYEITDVLVGKKAFKTDKYWIDVGYPWNVIEANSWILKNLENKYEHANIINSRIDGKLILGENVRIVDSVIEGNVYIDDGSVIGPFAYIRGDTYIGKRCNIGGGTTVKNSVIGNDVNAKHLCYIGDSLIGNNVNFGSSTQIANLKFDNSTIKIKVNGILKDTNKRKFGAVIGDNVKTGVNVSILPGRVIGSNSLVYPSSIVKESIPSNSEYKNYSL